MQKTQQGGGQREVGGRGNGWREGVKGGGHRILLIVSGTRRHLTSHRSATAQLNQSCCTSYICIYINSGTYPVQKILLSPLFSYTTPTPTTPPPPVSPSEALHCPTHFHICPISSSTPHPHPRIPYPPRQLTSHPSAVDCSAIPDFCLS